MALDDWPARPVIAGESPRGRTVAPFRQINAARAPRTRCRWSAVGRDERPHPRGHRLRWARPAGAVRRTRRRLSPPGGHADAAPRRWERKRPDGGPGNGLGW